MTIKLNLGGDNKRYKGFLNVDINSGPNVNEVANLNYKWPWKTGSIDVIRAYNIFEHLPDKVHTMNELWRVLKHGGIAYIRVPSTEGRGAFQDPTHVSFWNLNSFLYYGKVVDKKSGWYNKMYTASKRWTGFKGLFHITTIGNKKSNHGIIFVDATLVAIKK